MEEFQLPHRFFKASVLIVGFFCLLQSAGCGAANSGVIERISIGSGAFSMSEPTGATNADLRAFYYRPATWTADRPIVVVMHGFKRNAEDYRDAWIQYADQYNLLVVCPEFSEAKYPGVRYYNTGDVSDTDDETGNLQPKENWIFPVIDRVFDQAKIRSGAVGEKFALYSHSAGSQMVHRYVFLNKETKAKKIISANAGWYTMPDSNVAFPYGIKGLPINADDLTAAFAKPMTILLGEADTKSNANLRHTPLADAQGVNRFERGNEFFATAKKKAAQMGVPFNWQLITVPGVGHNEAEMGAVAAKLIAEDQ